MKKKMEKEAEQFLDQWEGVPPKVFKQRLIELLEKVYKDGVKDGKQNR